MWELLAAHGLAVLGGEGTLPVGVIPLRRPKRAQEGPLSAPESRAIGPAGMKGSSLAPPLAHTPQGVLAGS